MCSCAAAVSMRFLLTPPVRHASFSTLLPAHFGLLQTLAAGLLLLLCDSTGDQNVFEHVLNTLSICELVLQGIICAPMCDPCGPEPASSIVVARCLYACCDKRSLPATMPSTPLLDTYRS